MSHILHKNKFFILLYSALILIFFILPNESIAEDSTKSRKPSIWKNLGNDILISLEDAGTFYTASLHFSGKEWLYTAGITGSIALSFTADKQVKKNISIDSAKDFNNNFWDIPTFYGSFWCAGLGSLGIYTTGLLSGENSIRVTGRLLIEGVVIANVTTYAIKYITGRHRPYKTEDPFIFSWFETEEEMTSYPSGHSSAAFAFSTVLAERIDTWWARVGFYSLAALTAYARVRNNRHWFSDVITGSLIGFGAGFFVVYRENEREKDIKSGKKGGNKLSIIPSINSLSVVYKF